MNAGTGTGFSGKDSSFPFKVEYLGLPEATLPQQEVNLTNGGMEKESRRGGHETQAWCRPGDAV